MTVAIAQQIPGLGTDPLVNRRSSSSASIRLPAELAAQGPERVSKESARRLDKLRKSLKAIEADLKRR